eukprot:CAMPEP_0114995586 /NCGR_PEP_ID=MMETSP0216-20121206/13817_1 /TAXON_ID=223996 /ORGANISM="Protocruzia adherens, Strain Boccale" /LENGTH=128 /DNA_ID=CAMNT_0002359655 /DNA_START=47 /DNA_END=433 /DNA_ORIENTATION=+
MRGKEPAFDKPLPKVELPADTTIHFDMQTGEWESTDPDIQDAINREASRRQKTDESGRDPGAGGEEEVKLAEDAEKMLAALKDQLRELNSENDNLNHELDSETKKYNVLIDLLTASNLDNEKLNELQN